MKKKYKVLVADDEYWVRENLRTILDWNEYSLDFLEPAIDGEDALCKMNCNPDILIADINMPFITGVELVEIVKDKYPNVITIILSGYSDFKYVRESLLAGAIDYLLKPLNKNDLIQVLSKAVDKIGRDQSIKERLLKASYIVRDKELSTIISANKSAELDKISSQSLSDIELDFTGFTLVLVKIQNTNNVLKNKYMSDMNQLSFDIRKLIETSVEDKKHIIFNNIYSPNEYIIITELDQNNLLERCANLIKSLEQTIESIINISISKHHFSLIDIRIAYKEALSVFMSRQFCHSSLVIAPTQLNKRTLKKRFSTELENELLFSLKTKNSNMIKEIIFNQVGLSKCDNSQWLFIEVKQTVDRIINIILNIAVDEATSYEIAAIENLAGLMNMALETFCAEEVCSILEQIIDEAIGIKTNLSGSDTINETVQMVAEYIDKNYFESLSLSVLSKLFLVERSYLSRAFKQYIGENLMMYIAKKRVEKAIHLMQEGNLSLTDISYIVGYDDYSYFNRVFHKITSKSPSEFKSSKIIH